MNLEAKIGLFFRWALSIIGPIRTEGVAITRPSKLTDRKREAIDYKKTAVWDGKNLANLLTEQFGHLQKGPSGPVEPSTTAQIWKKMPVVAFYEGVPGIFGVYTNEFAANAQGNNFRVRHFGGIRVSPF